MKTYQKLARFIKLNDDGPQSCLNTTFTQDHKRKMPSWSINMDMNAYIIEPWNNQANYMQNMYMQRNIRLITKCNACK
jgi:hypothetical protein